MTDLIAWLKANDKRLWGCHASYKQAAAESGVSQQKIRNALFRKKLTGEVDENKKAKFIWEYTGVIKYWKCPDYECGSAHGVKGVSLTESQWVKLKKFVMDNAEEISGIDATAGFAVSWLAAASSWPTWTTLSEVMRLKKMPLPRVISRQESRHAD